MTLEATPPVPMPAGAGRAWLGAALALFGAVAAAALLVTARGLYDYGANPLTVLFIRAFGFVTLLALFLRLTGRPIRMAPSERYPSLALGLLLSFTTWANYTAVSLIPVSLSMLLLYTYPLMVAVAMRLVEGEKVRRIQYVAILIAFIGLAVSLEVAKGPLEPVGVALALASATGLTVIVLVSNRILQRADSRRLTLHMATTNSLCYGGAMLATGGPAIPGDPAIALILLVFPLGYFMAILGFFSAISLIGPTRASMFSNMEPIAAMSFAALALGQPVSGVGWIGAALVVGAVLVVQIAAAIPQATKP